MTMTKNQLTFLLLFSLFCFLLPYVRAQRTSRFLEETTNNTETEQIIGQGTNTTNTTISQELVIEPVPPKPEQGPPKDRPRGDNETCGPSDWHYNHKSYYNKGANIPIKSSALILLLLFMNLVIL